MTRHVRRAPSVLRASTARQGTSEFCAWVRQGTSEYCASVPQGTSEYYARTLGPARQHGAAVAGVPPSAVGAKTLMAGCKHSSAAVAAVATPIMRAPVAAAATLADSSRCFTAGRSRRAKTNQNTVLGVLRDSASSRYRRVLTGAKVLRHSLGQHEHVGSHEADERRRARVAPRREAQVLSVNLAVRARTTHAQRAGYVRAHAWTHARTHARTHTLTWHAIMHAHIRACTHAETHACGHLHAQKYAQTACEHMCT